MAKQDGEPSATIGEWEIAGGVGAVVTASKHFPSSCYLNFQPRRQNHAFVEICGDLHNGFCDARNLKDAELRVGSLELASRFQNK